MSQYYSNYNVGSYLNLVLILSYILFSCYVRSYQTYAVN